ncbi:type II secretion system protein GspC [Exilibacterium tricleocarpae]|uniref:Type II secretion system protein GspC n=1 Tax=Exilibacterium tricleocarpae TaxID=2591008 RepID=A0A545TZ71_9GAMM|nr:type II secretion system protein GspC [Exilibacterium tricleocarpae]TQV82516.1 type II secretion system protein GspC [Exilibacterium tricleocarpae]
MAASPLAQSALQQLNRSAAYLQRLPAAWWRQLCLALLAFWLCHTLAQLFWLLMPEPELAPLDAAALPVAVAAAGDNGASAVDIDALKSLNLFGEASKTEQTVVQENPEPQIEAAEETRLSLTLVGVVASSNPAAARAIIADAREQAIYSIDDELPVGQSVKLARVMDRQVILNNNGRYESLSLFDETTSGRRGPAISNRRPPVTTSRPRTRPVASAPRNLSRAQQSLADVMKVSIVREGGEVKGYKIRPGRNRSMFEQLGLQANDVVTAVNGITLDSSSKAMDVYKTMKGKTSAQLEIQRDGEVLTVDVDLDEVGEE